MSQATSPARELGAEPSPFLGAGALAVPSAPTWTVRAVALVRLLRPLDSLAALGGTWVGASLAGLPLLSPFVALLAVSNLLVLAASMAFNDWHDVAEDAVNRPGAPVSSGEVSRSLALRIAVGLFSAGVLVAALVGPLAALLICAFNFLSMAYTCRLKRWPLAGNLLVAVLSSYPLWCFMLLSPRAGVTQASLACSCIVFCIGREVLGTARDLKGDVAGGVMTAATVLGAFRANVLGTAFILGSGLLALVPVWRGEANRLYLVLLLLATVLGVRIAVMVLRTELGHHGGSMSARLVGTARLITAVMAVAFAWGLSVVAA